MPALTRTDIRKAIELELAIRDALADPQGDAGQVAEARVAALRVLLKQAPDDEVIDAAH